MAFPTTGLPATVEVSPGADLTDASAGWVWTDITSSVRLEDGIHITQGRGDGAGRVDPSVCRLRLDNRTGNFTPRNPLGAYYGTLGRNTPLRVSILKAEDDFDRTVSGGWGTEPLWGNAWSAFGAGGSITAADFDVTPSQGGRHFVPTDNAFRATYLGSLLLLDAEVSGTVDTSISNLTTAGIEPANVIMRAQDTGTYYLARVAVTVSEVVIASLYDPAGVQLASATVSGLTFDGSPWRFRAAIRGQTLALKVWAASGSEPAGWHVTATDDSITVPGWFGIRSGVAVGNTNTKPIEFRYDDVTISVDRFSGFVSSWPPRWDKSGNDATAPIEANGVLRRLGQGTPPSHSALRRSVMSQEHTGLLAYWPCEDLEHSTQAASAIPSRPAMAVSGTVDFAGFDRNATMTPPTRIGTDPLPDFKDGGSLYGTVPGGTSSPVAWSVQFAANARTDDEGVSIVLAEWTTPGGTYVRWEVKQTHPAGTTDVIAYNATGTPTTVLTDNVWIFDTPFMHSVDAVQNGANVDVRLWIFGQLLDSATLVGVTLARVASLTANPGLVSSANTISVGHVQVWDDRDAPQFQSPSSTADNAWQSYRGESATDRLARLCAEDGVSITVPAVSVDFETPMGLQRTGTLLDLLQECADADIGVLHESGFGLGYVPREARYNRAVDLALDFDQGQIAEPPEPTDDDQQLRNDITVRRRDGSSAQAVDEDSVSAVGRYDEEITVNHADDSRLADHAAWLLHLGT